MFQYIVVTILMLSPFVIVPLNNNGSMGWNPEYEIMAKTIVSSLMIAIMLLLYSLILQLVRFNRFYNESSKRCANMTVNVDGTYLQIIKEGSTIKLPLDQAELRNYIFGAGLRNPFFGKGLFIVTNSQNQKFVIPSLIFNESVGAFVVRDLFRNRSNYQQLTLKWKELSALYD